MVINIKQNHAIHWGAKIEIYEFRLLAAQDLVSGWVEGAGVKPILWHC
jgi:hypothetical protein